MSDDRNLNNLPKLKVEKTGVEDLGDGRFKLYNILTVDQSGQDSGIEHSFNIIILTIASIIFFELSGFWWWVFFAILTGFLSLLFPILTTILASSIVLYQFLSFLFKIFS
jgi:hypothetical protein